jgi:hypothetical protein
MRAPRDNREDVKLDASFDLDLLAVALAVGLALEVLVLQHNNTGGL